MAENKSISGVEAIRQLIEAQKEWLPIKPGNGEYSLELGYSVQAIGDYSHASGISSKAISRNAFSHGFGNIAGGKGFRIVAQEADGEAGYGWYTLNTVDGIEVGQNYIVRLSSVSSTLEGSVVEIDSTNKKIKVNKYNSNLVIEADDPEFPLNPDLNEDFDRPASDSNYLCIIGHPELGDINIGFNALAFGESNFATERSAVALGRENKSLGQYAYTEGFRNIANYGSHAEGHYNSAVGITTHAEGRENIASGYAAHVEGVQNIASGEASHAEGIKTEASGTYSHAEGSQVKAVGAHSHAEGDSDPSVSSYNYTYNNIKYVLDGAYGSFSHREGRNTRTIGEGAHAEGVGCLAFGGHSHAEGSGTLAYGGYSHAEGGQTQAIGPNGAHAEGYRTKAIGEDAHSEGRETEARGAHSHAEGCLTKAIGSRSHAEGDKSGSAFSRQLSNGTIVNGDAEGLYSHREGRDTSTKGSGAHAEGQETAAIGGQSHSEGYNTEALGGQSHAEGHSSIAIGPASHAGGIGTKATAEAQTAIGRYNKKDANALFIVGNGTGDADESRSNAFAVDKDGHAILGADPKEAMHAVSLGYFNNIADTKLDKVDGATNKSTVYAISYDGKQTMMLYTNDWHIASNGTIVSYAPKVLTDYLDGEPNASLITCVPTSDYQCANKKYVDDSVSIYRATIKSRAIPATATLYPILINGITWSDYLNLYPALNIALHQKGSIYIDELTTEVRIYDANGNPKSLNIQIDDNEFAVYASSIIDKSTEYFIY